MYEVIAASSIGENNSKCEFYTFDFVLGWYAVSTVLRTEEIVPQVVYQDWCLIYDKKVNVDVMYVHTHVIAFYIRVCLTIIHEA